MKMPRKRNIFVVGFMASGKTEFARRLAEQLGWRFVDTDREVERAAGSTIAAIFADGGERLFRRRESRMLGQTARRQGQVVAVGGGAVIHSGNIAAMRRAGVVIYLRTAFRIIFDRLERDEKNQRPLWKGKTKSERRRAMAELLNERKSSYARAAHWSLRTTDGGGQTDTTRAAQRLRREGWVCIQG